MIPQTPGTAWLEGAGGKQIPIQGSCTLGRAVTNQIALPDERVSRRHAILQAQEQHEYWLVDLGSRNGTYLNDRRVTHPTRLRDRDLIRVGQFEFTFRQPSAAGAPALNPAGIEQTVAEIKSAYCWLLVADIIGSTEMVQNLPASELPMVTGQWLAECKQTVEECGGAINQFLGDGFFAYWHDREKAEVLVHRALSALRRLQREERPAFRVVVHVGQVFIGGASLGEETLSGKEVHFVFRMEKLAGGLGEPRLMSDAAWSRLGSCLENAQSIGSHELAGFEGKYGFYNFD